jgi:hypothetical protein
LSALAHTFGRWREVSSGNGMEAPSFQALLDQFGEPPPPTMALPADGALKLPPAGGGLDEQLLQRYTGRNFDLQASVPLEVAARLLHRAFGAQEVRMVGPHASVLKKTSPSGGGLHPIEAFVLAQRVDGVAPGVYHYHPVEHELRPLRQLERAGGRHGACSGRPALAGRCAAAGAAGRARGAQFLEVPQSPEGLPRWRWMPATCRRPSTCWHRGGHAGVCHGGHQ